MLYQPELHPCAATALRLYGPRPHRVNVMTSCGTGPDVVPFTLLPSERVSLSVHRYLIRRPPLKVAAERDAGFRFAYNRRAGYISLRQPFVPYLYGNPSVVALHVIAGEVDACVRLNRDHVDEVLPGARLGNADSHGVYRCGRPSPRHVHVGWSGSRVRMRVDGAFQHFDSHLQPVELVRLNVVA